MNGEAVTDKGRPSNRDRHSLKDGFLTTAGDEDTDIADLTANFVLGVAQLHLSG